jgi:hypothetical protein
MTSEYDNLPDDLRKEVDALIKRVRFTQNYESRERLGLELYAYPTPRGTAWGVNGKGDGCNIWRGVKSTWLQELTGAA